LGHWPQQYIKSTPIKGGTFASEAKGNGESRTNEQSHSRHKHQPLSYLHVVTRTLAKRYRQARNQRGAGGAKPPYKIFRSPWKNVLIIGQNYWTKFKKFGPLSEKSSPPVVSQAGYRPGYR